MNMSLFNALNVSITMISWLSNARVECVCCSRSQPHAFSSLYYLIYAEERERVAQSPLHRNEMLRVRLKRRILHKPNQILILVDLNETSPFFLPNKIAERDIIYE